MKKTTVTPTKKAKPAKKRRVEPEDRLSQAEIDAAAADRFMLAEESILDPITPEEAANCHLSEDGQLLIANEPTKPVVPVVPDDVEKAFKSVTEPMVVALPELAPQPKLSTPHCRMCKYFISNDERGALWASQGLCTAYHHAAKVVPEDYCNRFLFNEALRDGQVQ